MSDVTKEPSLTLSWAPAKKWIQIQVDFGRAPNTVDAYKRALEDYLSFCKHQAILPETAKREDIACYVRDLSSRSNPHGIAIRTLDSGVGLANATMQQRLTVVRLFYDYLMEEGLRQDNPVGRGRYTPGKGFGGTRDRALIPRYQKLPWIPDDEQWRAVLEATREEPLRNRVMLALAYDAGLRREELCTLLTGDIDPSHRLLHIRAEQTKNRRARTVPYSEATSVLYAAYLQHRRELSRERGPLFLSESRRNHAQPISIWTWSKAVEGIANFSATGRNIVRYPIARKVFGQAAIDAAIEQVRTVMLAWGYSKTRSDGYLTRVMCALFLASRSPRLEDLATETIALVARRDMPFYEDEYVVVSRVLVHLGVLSHPITPLHSLQKTTSTPQQVPPVWGEWCQRWHATSTLAASTRQGVYSRLLTVGRWLAQEHPEIESPEQWTRELTLEFTTAVDRLKVGQWAYRSLPPELVNKPIKPKAKVHLFSTMRMFFRDCQEWEWIPRRFDPARCFATPRSIKALVGPDPRIIADDIWAKLLWAGLNLTADDLASRSLAPSRPREHRYPLEMVKAIVVVWLFCGLRRNEIGRLRVGCIRRWQSNSGLLPETNSLLSKDAICLLDIPTNKTGTAFTKPVDRVVGEAIKEWERIRPTQPPAVDIKTGELVDYLFTYRSYRVGLDYLNRTVIPLLCYKAGVPLQDARGSITTHRARSTIASQLANGKDPMTLLELQQWLGHRSPESTRHYVMVSPTKLSKSYTDAGYFGRNVRTIEVLIDQEAVTNGAAVNGEAWKFYDLGHGYCTYDFFDQCPHRMACAKCAFYRPKGSSQAQILEAKANLLRMKQEIPLSEDEQAAVDDGLAALEKLCDALMDTPTPSGPTPRELRVNSHGRIPLIPFNHIRRQSQDEG